MSYLTLVKTTMVEAIQATFDTDYPVDQFAGVYSSIEYPVKPQAYPGIWVDYDDTDDLVQAGVGHLERKDPATGDPVPAFTRWRFTGTVSFTVVALTSLERDRLYDELVNVIAFGSQDPVRGRFRGLVEANPLVVIEARYDALTVGGAAATPGTPWLTDDIVYEKTVNLDVIGEFYPAATTGPLVLLSRVQVDPPSGVLPDGSPLIGAASGVTTNDWH